MKAVEFVGQTLVLQPPPDWDNEGRQKCGGLPILAQVVDGIPMMMSVWRPSPEDLAALNSGAHVCLRIVGTAHPPISVFVERLEELP